MPVNPPRVAVAGDFLDDCQDLLARYKLTIDHFYAVKSRRLKVFIDLRMAAECLLKAHIAYYCPGDSDRKQVISRVEKYSHHVAKMASQVHSHIARDKWERLVSFIEQLDQLPVGLRYRLDVFDFRDANEEFYYRTVGDDGWLHELYDAIYAVGQDLGEVLSSHSRILTGSELWEEFQARSEEHRKYAK